MSVKGIPTQREFLEEFKVGDAWDIPQVSSVSQRICKVYYAQFVGGK